LVNQRQLVNCVKQLPTKNKVYNTLGCSLALQDLADQTPQWLLQLR
jgi:hypothetical protein